MFKTSPTSSPSRPTLFFLGLLFLAWMPASSFAQKPAVDLAAVGGPAGYADVQPIALDSPAAAPIGSAPLLVYPAGAVSSREAFSSSFDANTAGNGPGFGS